MKGNHTPSPHLVLLSELPSRMKHKFRSLGGTLKGSSAAKHTGDEATDIEARTFSPEDYVQHSSKELSGLYERKQAEERRVQEDEQRRVKKLVNEMSPAAAATDAMGTAVQTLFDVHCNHYLVPGFYFLLGAFLATPSLSIKYFAIRVLKIDPGSFGLLYGIVVMPWFFKPVFGLISDTRPIYNKHRAPYLVVCSFLTALVWLLVAIPGNHSRTALGFGVLMVLSNVFICFCDVIIDCMVARTAREEMETHRGRTQSLAWLARHSGTLFGITLGGYLVAHVDNLHFVFGATAVFPVFMFIGAFFLREKRSPLTPLDAHHHRANGGTAVAGSYGCFGTSTSRHKPMWSQLKKAARDAYENKVLVRFALYFFIFSATPNSSMTFSYYLIKDLHFTEAFMAWLSIAGVVSMMVGLGAYQLFLVNVDTRTIIRISIAVSTFLSLLPLMLVTGANRSLGIDDRFFVLGDDVAESFAAQLAMIPMQVTVASVCPEGGEGLLYAGFMSISNFGGAVSTWLGAIITSALGITKANYDNMWLLVAICSATNILPYFFTKWLPSENTVRRKSVFSLKTALSDSETVAHATNF